MPANEQLRSYVQRISRLEDDKKSVGADIKEVYQEAKGNGFDVKILKSVVKRARKNRTEVETEDQILASYEAAITESS